MALQKNCFLEYMNLHMDGFCLRLFSRDNVFPRLFEVVELAIVKEILSIRHFVTSK